MVFVASGQGVVPKSSDQTEKGHNQGFRQTFFLHVRVFGHLQHPPPLGAGPAPVRTRPASKLSTGASSSPSQWLPAQQSRWGLLHLPWHQQQHPSQLPARRDIWTFPSLSGRHSAITEAGSPTTTLPLLFHAAPGGSPSRTDLLIWLRFLCLWAIHAAGQEGGRSRREEDSLLNRKFLF